MFSGASFELVLPSPVMYHGLFGMVPSFGFRFVLPVFSLEKQYIPPTLIQVVRVAEVVGESDKLYYSGRSITPEDVSCCHVVSTSSGRTVARHCPKKC